MSLVTSQKDNGIGIITFNNPPKGFLTSEMIAETIPMIEDLDNDDSIKTVIFTGGIKGIFIKHFSVEEILAMSDLAKERRKKTKLSRVKRAPVKKKARQMMVFDVIVFFNCPEATIINSFTSL